MLVVLAGLDLVGNKAKRKLVEDDVIADRQNGKKRQRRKRGHQPSEEPVIMGERMEPGSGGTIGD